MIKSMLLLSLIIFLASYIQANFGFSFTVIAVALVIGFGLHDLHTITAVLTFLVIINASVGVASSRHSLSWRFFILAALPMIPGLGFGVYLLYSIHPSNADTLQFILGACVAGFGVLLSLPRGGRKRISVSEARVITAGSLSGLLGGLFGAAGPPLVYELYRQMSDVHCVRMTLLSLLLVFGLFRLTFIAFGEGITFDIVVVTLTCIPAAILGAWVGNRILLPISEKMREKGAMLLLIPIGVMLIFGSVYE